MRTFSIWNYGSRQYDYYSAGAHHGTHITQPTVHTFGGSQIGMTPDEFATRLPPDATRAGSGPVAKGQVASFGSSGLPTRWLIYGAALYLAWRFLR